MKSFHSSAIARFGVLVIIVVVWQVGSMFTSKIILPSIFEVANALYAIVTLKTFPALLNEIAITLYEIGFGFIFAAVSGLTLSFIFSFNKLVREAYLPFVVIIWAIPHIIFYPVMIVIFGLGSLSKIAYVFLATFPVITLGAMTSISKVDKVILTSARSLGASSSATLFKVIFPASISSIVSVLRVGFGLAIITAIVAEMLGSLHGIGILLNTTSQTLKTSEYFALVLLVMGTAYGLNLAASLVERRVKAWSHM
ncbi:MAG: ABC transporter permease subunit [Thaumarchaeota archaeon]|nr:ABC transporter permease subunit [Nitrososphaerota archaeon]